MLKEIRVKCTYRYSCVYLKKKFCVDKVLKKKQSKNISEGFCTLKPSPFACVRSDHVCKHCKLYNYLL